MVTGTLDPQPNSAGSGRRRALRCVRPGVCVAGGLSSRTIYHTGGVGADAAAGRRGAARVWGRRDAVIRPSFFLAASAPQLHCPRGCLQGRTKTSAAVLFCVVLFRGRKVGADGHGRRRTATNDRAHAPHELRPLPPVGQQATLRFITDLRRHAARGPPRRIARLSSSPQQRRFLYAMDGGPPRRPHHQCQVTGTRIRIQRELERRRPPR
jgi:hypothetical protein